MTSARRLRSWLVMLATLSLVACGGGSTTIAGGGTGGTGISAGAISAFGSVYVNGVRYRTSEATQIFVDDVSAMEGDLDVGMVIRVEYQEADGQFDATRIDYAKELEGPVTDNTVNPLTGTGSLTVLGQTVSVDGTAVYRNSGIGARPTIADLQFGDIVEVSGFPSGSGALVATRIELESIGSSGVVTSEVAGVIDSLEISGFRIGALLITYDAMTEFKDGLTASDLEPGLFVKAKGETSDGVNLTALSIEAIDDLVSGEEDEDFELAGFVTSRTDTTLVVSGAGVALTETTECQPSGDCVTIQVGDRVEVRGRFGAGGVRIAEEVEIKTAIEADEYEGTVVAVTVDDVDADPNVGILTVSVAGVPTEFLVTATTIMVDDADASLNLSQLAVDDAVEVYAYLDGGDLVATKIEREDSSGADSDSDGDSVRTDQTASDEEVQLVGTVPVALAHNDADADTIVVTSNGGTTTYEIGVDYAISEESLGSGGHQVLIARVADGAVGDGETVLVSYHYEVN